MQLSVHAETQKFSFCFSIITECIPFTFSFISLPPPSPSLSSFLSTVFAILQTH